MTDPAGEPEGGKKAPPVFLERQSYRRRRLMDAARLMPAIGALLFAVPLLWPRAGEVGAVATSDAIRYLFIIWAVLIGGNFLFGWLTRGWSGGGHGDLPGSMPVPGVPPTTTPAATLQGVTTPGPDHGAL